MRIKNLTALLLLLITLAACKPTEKGYRDAYDAAKSKREQKDPDDDLLTGGHRLLSEESTNWKVLAGDSLQIQHMLLKPADGEKWPQSGPYRLAVAMFKMTTNANSMLSDLRKKGSLNPVIATDGKDRYFIIAGSSTYADSLGYVLNTFHKEHPGFQYIGLSTARPLIIVGR
ncbi:MAG: hypothetical protein K2K45_11900 [Muribaculaceae bacterium]|nr:hypothetical protein [Muribaculaceae bacterium]